VLEDLLQRGSSDLVSEIADGFHFDLVQRMSFLEKYEYSYDARVEKLIRQKALVVREHYLMLQLRADSRLGVVTASGVGDSSASGGGGATSCWSTKVSYARHSDDTTDEECSSDEDEPASPWQNQQNSRQGYGIAMPRQAPGLRQTTPTTQANSVTSRGSVSSNGSSTGSPSSTSSDCMKGSVVDTSAPRDACQKQGAEFIVGALCRSIAIVTMREGESFDSDLIADFPKDTVLVILALGSDRRVNVRDLTSNNTGWISVRTRMDEPLIAVCGK